MPKRLPYLIFSVSLGFCSFSLPVGHAEDDLISVATGSLLDAESSGSNAVNFSSPSDTSPSDKLTADDSQVAPTASFAKLASRRRGQVDSHRYIGADFLLWWAGDSSASILTSQPDGTALSAVGLPSESTTYLGGANLGDWPNAGLRLRGGRRLEDRFFSRFDWAVWHLFENQDDFDIRSTDGSPILARPFFNASTNAWDAQLLSYPGIANGAFRSQYTRQALGVDALGSICLYGSDCRWLEFFSGYQFIWLRDALNLHEDTTLVPGGLIAPGTRFVIDDEFEAGNAFHLIPLGLRLSGRSDKWEWNVRGSVGLGFVAQTVEIYGRTQTFTGGNSTGNLSGGLLALHTNMGRHERTRFAWVPQLQFNLARQVSKNTTAQIGYTLINLNNVVRAADHVPTTIDPNNIPPVTGAGGVEPAFAFHEESLWLHGLNVGATYQF